MIAETKKDHQNLMNFVKNESRNKGIDLNSKETEVMAISKTATPERNIFVEIKLIQQQLSNIWTLSSHKQQKSFLSKFKNCTGKSSTTKDEKSI